MDLNNIEIPKNVKVFLEFKGEKIYSDKEKTQAMAVVLHSPAADAVIDYKRKASNRIYSQVKKNGKNVALSYDSNEADEVERLVAYTVAVENMEFNGDAVTPENIKMVYENPDFEWIKNQVSAKIKSWDAFLE